MNDNTRDICDVCGSDQIYHGPPDCPMCGAPNCCQECCRQMTLELERDRLRAKESASIKCSRKRKANAQA